MRSPTFRKNGDVRPQSLIAPLLQPFYASGAPLLTPLAASGPPHSCPVRFVVGALIMGQLLHHTDISTIAWMQAAFHLS